MNHLPEVDINTERVIFDHEGRTYHVQSTLSHIPDGIVLPEASPLPVVGEAGNSIGFCSVSKNGDTFVADLYIDYASSERLLIQTGALPRVSMGAAGDRLILSPR